jgi:hypothetical protein
MDFAKRWALEVYLIPIMPNIIPHVICFGLLKVIIVLVADQKSESALQILKWTLFLRILTYHLFSSQARYAIIQDN